MRNMFESLRLHIITMQTFTERDWPATAYNRPFSWLYWVWGGTPTVSFQGARYRMRRGLFYLAPLGVTAEYTCGKQASVAGCAFTAPLYGAEDLFHRIMVPAALCVESIEETDALVRTLQKLSTSCLPGDVLEADSLLRRILARFIATAPLDQFRESARLTERFAPVFEYIEAHLAGAIVLEDLAQLMHWHPTHFAEEFTRSLGVSPRRYINRRRIELAQYLLETTDWPIKTVAAKVGFSDPYYFSRAFTRHAECTPTACRTHSHAIRPVAIG